MGAGRWTIGLLASCVFHAALAVLAAVFLVTRDVPQPETPETSLAITALNVPHDSAATHATDSEAVRETLPDGQRASGAQIPVTDAVATEPQVASSSSVEAPKARLKAAAPFADLLSIATETARPAAEAVMPIAQVAAVVPDVTAPASIPTASRPANRRAPASAEIASAAIYPRAAIAAKTRSDPVPLTEPRFAPVTFLPDDADVLPAASASTDRTLPTPVPDGEEPDAVQTTGAILTTARPDIAAASEAAPDQFRTGVLLAWTGDLTTEIREATVSAAAALRVKNPGEEGQGLRDALAKDLGAVDCARAQTEYDPATGTIVLRGHVKSDSDRDTLITALQAGLQGALPIRDDLRRLPAPQCEVLTRMADTPLPQSVEQFTNPLVIGEDLHARVYAFKEGDRIRFELQGADYPGWIYLDYYDNEGNVLHLMPNPSIPLMQLAAKAPLVFGGGGAADIAKDKLELRVSPPFGEDIVVAMVTNESLFDDDRPMVEDAAPYLAAVEARVIELRERSEDFRGEWVYLFVETSP